ncbi:MAG TPA: hypothetical protein VFT02_15715, partial [Pyrinomonadaceae bacterium]|nr:hypothetical protein [Pyrinomonadaceae bacterium]
MGHLRALLAASFQICCLLTAIATAQDQTLQVGTPVERQISTSQTHTFSVTLDENMFIQVVVVQRGVDVVVKVLGPDGKELGAFDTPNGPEGPENVSFVAETAGAYRIAVTPLTEQATEGKYEIKIIEMREATEQELKSGKNKKGLKEKGIALLAEAENLMQEIRSPQTRIRSQIHASRMLRGLDEKRAAKLLNDAAAGLKELVAAVDPTEPEYMNEHSPISQLRHEILQELGGRDSDAALSFLQATKLPMMPFGSQREHEMQENALELMIADQIAAKDPRKAFEIARRKLKSGYSSNLLNTVGSMRQKHPELATELATEIAGKLLQEQLLSKAEAASMSINLLHSCRASDKSTQSFSNSGIVFAGSLISEELCRELFQKAYQDALSFSPPATNIYTPEREAAWTLLNGLQQLGPALNGAVNGGLAGVEKKLSEINPTPNNFHASIQRVHVRMSNGGPVGEAVEAVLEAPEDTREQLYIQVANAAAARGDSEAARQIINTQITNPYQRRMALTNLEQQEMYRSMSHGKVEEALKSLSTVKSPRERASMLLQIAQQIGPGYKRAAALNLLEQARALVSPGL